MRGKRHVAWAGTSLVLGSIGFGLGRLEALPADSAERPLGTAPMAPRDLRSAAPESTRRPSESPTPARPTPTPRSSRAPLPETPPKSSRGAHRPGTALLWAPPSVDPDALRLVQLLHAFRQPAEPTQPDSPDPLEGVASLLLQGLKEEEEQQLAFLVALSRYQDVSALCESYAQSSAALPLLRALYGADPSEEHLDLILRLLSYEEYTDLDPNLLAVLAMDWPRDERVSEFLELRRQALGALPDSSSEDEGHEQGGGAREEPAEGSISVPELYEELEVGPTLYDLVTAHEEDPAAFMAWLSTKTSPRWKSLRLLLRVATAPRTAPDDDAFRRLQHGEWRHLDPGNLVDFVALLEQGSASLELQRLVLRRLALNPDLDLQAVHRQVSARSKFFLSLASVELLGSDETPLSVLEDYAGLLEAQPFVARRLLPELWELLPRMPLADAIPLADAFQRAGDPRLADEILRHAEQGPWVSAARDHLAQGHSLRQFRDWALQHER